MVPPKQNRPMGVEDYENRWRPGYEGLLVDNYLAPAGSARRRESAAVAAGKVPEARRRSGPGPISSPIRIQIRNLATGGLTTPRPSAKMKSRRSSAAGTFINAKGETSRRPIGPSPVTKTRVFLAAALLLVSVPAGPCPAAGPGDAAQRDPLVAGPAGEVPGLEIRADDALGHLQPMGLHRVVAAGGSGSLGPARRPAAVDRAEQGFRRGFQPTTGAERRRSIPRQFDPRRMGRGRQGRAA